MPPFQGHRGGWAQIFPLKQDRKEVGYQVWKGFALSPSCGWQTSGTQGWSQADAHTSKVWAPQGVATWGGETA